MNTSLNSTISDGDIFDMGLFRRLFYGYCATTSLYILVGTPLCVWFMAAILTSPDMRWRLRNQLLCAICLFYMLKSTVCGGLEVSFFAVYMKTGREHSCYVYSLYLNLRNVFEFAGTWLVVILLLVYLAQIFNYDPTSTLTPLVVKMGKGALLALPLVLAIIIMPSVGLVFSSEFAKKNPGCIVYGEEGYLALRSLDYMVPLIISAILLIVCTVYYRRFRREFSTSPAMQTGLMGQGRQVDSVVAYLVVIFMDIACRLPEAFRYTEVDMNANQRLSFTFISWMIVDSRSIILPWGWLLLEDVKERIKIWRPWYRAAAGIDLTVTYSSEQNTKK